MNPAPLLEAWHIRFAYSEEPILHDLDVSLRCGEVMVVLGPNGSGKSTLIKVLMGFLRGAGRIDWGGRSLSDWPRRHLSRYLAYLPQFPAYEPAQTAGEVLRLGRAPYWGAFGLETTRDLEVVAQVSQALDLADLLARPMDELSGGQRQRVFIGRCLVQEPKALLLDEPSTSLDLGHQVELGRLLRRLADEQGLGVFLASHDLNLSAAFADRLLLLEAGRIVAQGAPAEVLRPDLLSKVYGIAMSRLDRPDGKLPVVFPDV